MKGGNLIRLIVTDIDGCLGPGEAQPYDLEVLGRVAECNRRARRGEEVPAITLCSGRPAAYVDAMMQAVSGFVPAVFENGAGLYFPEGYRFAWNPALPGSARATIRRARELVEECLVQTGVATVQPGKEMAVTLFPSPGHHLDEVGAAAMAALKGKGLACRVEVSVSSVGIWLDGIDKGSGVRWLAKETGIPLAEMAGVTDTWDDLPFLRLVGFRAAPANADHQVRQSADYVSPYRDGRGLLNIIECILGRGAS
jgi:hydroxymethylpyrimidine pyrophosphatase-like HAD family hydrolase